MRQNLNSNSYSVGHPAVSKDGKTLYFASDMPGGFGGVDLYKVSINSDGTFGVMENLGADVNTAKNEFFPWVGEDGMLFFSSDGHGGLGGLDVFVIYEANNSWIDLTNLGNSLNSSSDDFAFVLSDDGRTGFVSSNRSLGKGSDDIYFFELQKSLSTDYRIKGVIVDKNSGKKLSEVEVALYDNQNQIIAKTLTNSEGVYSFDLDKEKGSKLGVKKDDYFEEFKKLDLEDLENGVSESVDFQIEKTPDLAMYILTTDKETEEPLDGVIVEIIDNLTGEKLGEFTTGDAGYLVKPLEGKSIGDQVSYDIKMSKDGYISLIQTYNYSIQPDGKLNINEKLSLALVKIGEGSDLGKLIDLNPIYFDLGKYDIRKDAGLELDKIIKIMNENPKIELELGAHTDSRGSSASNLLLSNKRAKASVNYIKSRIVNPNRIVGKGYGETKLLNECKDGVRCSDSKHSLNRRTEFKIVKMN